MQFLLLIHTDENATANPAEMDKMSSSYAAYTQELKNAGVLRGGERLDVTKKGAKVTVRDGKTRIVDGPFTETKEVLGGFYLLECASLAEANKWAAKCPGASHGTLEVRAIVPMTR